MNSITEQNLRWEKAFIDTVEEVLKTNKYILGSLEFWKEIENKLKNKEIALDFEEQFANSVTKYSEKINDFYFTEKILKKYIK